MTESDPKARCFGCAREYLWSDARRSGGQLGENGCSKIYCEKLQREQPVRRELLRLLKVVAASDVAAQSHAMTAWHGQPLVLP